MTFLFGAVIGAVLTTLFLAFNSDDDLYEDERRDY